MAIKNHKPTQTKGVPGQSKPNLVKTGPIVPSHSPKFVVRTLIASQRPLPNSSKIHAAGGHKRKLYIKPLPPQYPDSLFKNKEEYDAMVREVVKNAKNGNAIMRNTPLPQNIG